MNIKEKKNLDDDAFWDTMVDFVCAPVLMRLFVNFLKAGLSLKST